MSVAVDSPMTAKDYVKAIHVFTRRTHNPTSSASSSARAPARLRFDPGAARRHQQVVAICELSDGSVLVRQGRCHHHARRLPGGFALMAARTLINVPQKAKRGESSRSRR
jgi:hypothetical protein